MIYWYLLIIKKSHLSRYWGWRWDAQFSEGAPPHIRFAVPTSHSPENRDNEKKKINALTLIRTLLYIVCNAAQTTHRYYFLWPFSDEKILNFPSEFVQPTAKMACSRSKAYNTCSSNIYFISLDICVNLLIHSQSHCLTLLDIETRPYISQPLAKLTLLES